MYAGAGCRLSGVTVGAILAGAMRDDGSPSDPTIRRLLVLICVLGVLAATYVSSWSDAGGASTEGAEP